MFTECPTWWQDNVYACASEAKDGLTIGESLDEGSTFSVIHHLSPSAACGFGGRHRRASTPPSASVIGKEHTV